MSEIGELLTGQERLAPGVFGYTVETERGLYVPWIAAEAPDVKLLGRLGDEPLQPSALLKGIAPPLRAAIIHP